MSDVPSTAATAQTADELAARQRDLELPPPRSNRPVTLVHRLEYVLVRLAFMLFAALGVDRASDLAGGVMRRLGPLVRPVSRRAEDNLRYVFPDWSDEKIRGTVAGIWENLGRTAAEYPHLAAFDPEKSVDRVSVNISPAAEARRKLGAPSVLISGHFANWEVMPLVLHSERIDYAVIYRPVNNPLVDKLIVRLRGEVMSRRMIAKGYDGARDAMAQLKAGRCVAMLADQKLNSGIAVTLLGRRAMTPTAAARLAVRFGVPVIPSAIVRRGGARFEVTMRDPIAFKPTGRTGEDVGRLTQLINDAIGREIEAHPEQWLWFHRRWPKEDVAAALADRRQATQARQAPDDRI
ncbi:MAG: lauroyl acyltransferase [Alphaproteobacteria bacterium]|nr:lauroyl acyltransferase [Alphaproteobacteria bacterium]